MKEKIIKLLEESTARCVSEGLFEVKNLPFIETGGNPRHGPR